MSWFILILACILLWAVTDILYKASSDHDDPLSQYKTFIWIGIVMVVAGWIMSNWSDTLLDSVKRVKDNLYLIPLFLVYSGALLFSLLGKKHLAASVVSPLENIDGALAVIIIYFYFLLTGYIHPSYGVSIMGVIASVLIVIGIVLLGSQEQALMRGEEHLSEDKKRHRLGALALLFPIIYNLIDGFLIAEVSGISSNSDIVAKGSETSIPAIDIFIFECVSFAVVAIGIWLYMLIAKKYTYNPFRGKELIRFGAATGETFGTMTFVFAVSIKPTLTAPIVSSYCLVTMVLARIFLKERLTKKQYLSLAVVLLGIALLGITEIFSI